MPVNDRHLSGDQGGRLAVAVIHDFEQVLRLAAGEGVAQPVVEDQELGASKGVEKVGVGAVRVGHGQLMQESGGAVVADGEVMPASGMGERGTQERLADTGRAEDQDVQMVPDPLTLSQVENETTVKALLKNTKTPLSGRLVGQRP